MTRPKAALLCTTLLAVAPGSVFAQSARSDPPTRRPAAPLIA